MVNSGREWDWMDEESDEESKQTAFIDSIAYNPPYILKFI